jgi:hypothetical protein
MTRASKGKSKKAKMDESYGEELSDESDQDFEEEV